MQVINKKPNNYYFTIDTVSELKVAIFYIFRLNDDIDKYKNYKITDNDKRFIDDYIAYQIVYRKENDAYFISPFDDTYIIPLECRLSVKEYIRRYEMSGNTIY